LIIPKNNKDIKMLVLENTSNHNKTYSPTVQAESLRLTVAIATNSN